MKAIGLLVVGIMSMGIVRGEVLEERCLRGYGVTRAERVGNEVVVEAEGEEQARLWAARFWKVYGADAVAPGVVKLAGDGYVSVRREGARVMFRYTEEEPKSEWTEAWAEIPMYLNCWDENSFMFYYRPGERPEGTKHGEYDPEGEFDFMKEMERSGVVFWARGQWGDTSVGINNHSEWDWAKRMADARGLPVALNTDIGASHWVRLEGRHGDDLQQQAPHFSGSFHSIGEPHAAGHIFWSWASRAGRRETLQNLVNILREYNTSNVVDILEPHGELYHGHYTLFTEWGPLVDASFREYLKETYGSVEAVAARWEDAGVKRWEDCVFPEIAEFAGWGPGAIDLSGSWRGKYLEPKEAGEEYQKGYGPRRNIPEPQEVPEEWVQEGYDDSEWPLWIRQMPGHDATFWTVKRPAVLRRTFELAEPGERTWLYVWDLSNAFKRRVSAWVNGVCVGSDTVRHYFNHWMVAEVTDVVRAGTNTLALELPDAHLGYRVYLTNQEPKFYPYFGKGMNAKWVDFCGWQEWVRGQDIEMALKMIRGVEKDKNIISMAPGNFANTLRELAKRYGTRFHDTGGTGASWQESLPMLMQSAGLPFTVEPGGPAQDVAGFKRMWNLYMKTGIQSVHYFIHVGNVMWKDEIRAEFERILPAIKMMGRMAKPKSDIALVLDSRINMLMGFPWRMDVASAYPSGYWDWTFNEAMKFDFQLDAVTPLDFENGTASRYPFLIDANNTIMRAEDVARIEAYVREGGTYVAMFQTGRHSPEEPDRWMLSELTGCELQEMTPYAYKQDEHGVMRISAGDKGIVIVGEGEKKFLADGAKFKAVKDDVSVLATWEKGGIAIAERTIGKGRIILYGIRPHALWRSPESDALGAILAERGARKLPIELLGKSVSRLHPRHYVTTDGLRDVWLICGEEGVGRDHEYEFVFRDGKERELTDVLTGARVEQKGIVKGGEWIMATSPRGDNAGAVWHWVQNQFGWWQGGQRKEDVEPLEEVETGAWNVLDISSGWEITDGVETHRADLGAWIKGEDFTPEQYRCRREIEIPREWVKGTVEVWAVGMYASMFTRGGDVGLRLNGEELRDLRREGFCGLELPLKAGEKGMLELEVRKDNDVKVRGFGGPILLYFRPEKERLLDLSGAWEAYTTMTDRQAREVSLPGEYGEATGLRKTFSLETVPTGERIWMEFISERDALTGVIVNGTYLRRHHHRFGNRTSLDITRWLKAGENEIFLVSSGFGPQKGRVLEVGLYQQKKE